jgi:hypothetical protein
MIDAAGHIAVLRTQLRGVNIEYSALIRGHARETKSARLAELRGKRHALMALIAARSMSAHGALVAPRAFIHSTAFGKAHAPSSLGIRSFTRLRRLWRLCAADTLARLRLRTRSLAHGL